MNRRTKVAKYVLPSLLSQCAFFLFTIVDGVFVGHGVGTDALGAVNLTFPYIMIISAVFMLSTIGGVTVTAIRMGRKDMHGANQAFMHSMAATAVFALIFTVIGCCFTSPLATLLGAGETFHYMACDYLFWYCAFAIPSAFNIALMGFGRNDGAPVMVMAATILSTSLNIFLDWLFVFPLKMGMKGAAIATGLSQTVSLLIILAHFLMQKGQLRLGGFVYSGALMRKLLKRGMPEMLSQFATPIATLCMNMMLIRYVGDEGVNAFSILGYIISFAFAVFVGISEGMQPLFGQSYGDKNAEELRYFQQISTIVSIIGSAVVYVFIIMFGRMICVLFGAGAAATELAVAAIPSFGWAFLFIAPTTVISAYLYSTKRTSQSVAINVLRGFVMDPLCILGLTALTAGASVWWAMGVAEVITFCAAMLLMMRSEKNGVDFNRK